MGDIHNADLRRKESPNGDRQETLELSERRSEGLIQIDEATGGHGARAAWRRVT